MWKTILESSFTGRIIICGLACLFVWFMQARYERIKTALAQKEEQCLILQNANKKQQENIARLMQEQAKQQELLVQMEQEKRALAQVYQNKLAQVYKSTDKASTEWKQTRIPAPVLQILKQK